MLYLIKKIVRCLLSTSGHLEVFAKRAITVFAPIKKIVKKKIKKYNKCSDKLVDTLKVRNDVKNALMNSGIKDGDIVIIHSSADGVSALNMQSEEILQFLRETLGYNTTLVFPTFPLENTKHVPADKIRKYDPQNAICWTGMIPNIFLTQEEVIRSRFPFNTLAAQGPRAQEMMENDLNSIRPHDVYSPWYYCTSNHAKILFFGTTSIESNTILDHMAPDIMGEDWPILNWYEKSTYKILLSNQVIDKEIEIQRGKWFPYSIEYKTDKWFKKNGLLRDISTEICIEIVDDSYVFLNTVIDRARHGKLPYLIPKRFWKHK